MYNSFSAFLLFFSLSPIHAVCQCERGGVCELGKCIFILSRSLSPRKDGDWCIFQTQLHNQRGSCGLSDASCKFYKARGGGESERATAALESLTSVCLFLWQAVFAPVCLPSPPLIRSFVDQGWSRSISPQGPMSDRACGRAWMSELNRLSGNGTGGGRKIPRLGTGHNRTA